MQDKKTIAATTVVERLHPYLGANSRAATVGSLFHAVMASYFRDAIGLGKRLRRDSMDLEFLWATLWREADAAGIEDQAVLGDVELYLERAAKEFKWVGELLALPGPVTVRGVEQRLYLRDLGVRCVFDLVLDVGDQPVIIDYKTGRGWGGGFRHNGAPIFDERTALQMQIYDFATWEAKDASLRGALIYIYDARAATFVRFPEGSSAQRARTRAVLERAMR